MTKMWVIRAGKDTLIFDLFLKENFVSVGEDIGEIDGLSLDDIKRKLKSKVKNPDFTAGVIRRFMEEVEIGDYVVSTYPDGEYLLLGEIKSDCEYVPDLVKMNKYTPYRRSVKWISKVPRDKLSKPAKQSMSAQITVFEVKEKWQKQIFKHQEPLDVNSEIIIPSDDKLLNIGYDWDSDDKYIKDKILFKYADLYKEGLLTKAEFEKKKKELL